MASRGVLIIDCCFSLILYLHIITTLCCCESSTKSFGRGKIGNQVMLSIFDLKAEITQCPIYAVLPKWLTDQLLDQGRDHIFCHLLG